MLNHFNFKLNGDTVLLTNDFGMYSFMKKAEFQKFAGGKITPSDSCYSRLHENLFMFDKPAEVFIDDNYQYLRTLKSYAFGGTALHIFAVTNACNMNCIYCQAKDTDSKLTGFMSEDTGKRAIELAMQSPEKNLTFEFQGGEPLLNFDVVKSMIEHSKKINTGKTLHYTIVSNLVALTDEILDYLIKENISICTSLDGNPAVQNNNRKLKTGAGSYEALKKSIKKVRAAQKPIGAIQTTSRYSLDHPREIVDAYVELGITGIFLRPLTPLGFAHSYWDEVGYSPEEFLRFYREALEYIITLNLEGNNFPEIHASYFLKKILGGYSDNYMELRSPCGASIGQLSYYYDGSVYTCDEGRMLSEAGDCTFKLGNVYENTYNQLMESITCKATCTASVVESLASCCDCVYQPYCGVCPVVTYAETKDIFSKSPGDYRCEIYKGMLDILFEKIYNDDKEVMQVFRKWIEV